MTTYRRIGTTEDDYECAASVAADVYALANAELQRLIDDFVGVANLPVTVRFSDAEPGGWHGQEQKFAKAVAAGNWLQVVEIGEIYLNRVRSFCDRSRITQEITR